MNAKKWAWAFLSAVGIMSAVFCLRRGWERPLLALADAFSVGGFLTLAFSVLPRLVRSELFDGFSYAARSALAGFFPSTLRTYSGHKKEREEHRDGGSIARESVIVGCAFLTIGVAASLFFF